jgi:hypothetical protein
VQSFCSSFFNCSTHFKVFGQAFFKKLAVSKGSALVAFRRKRNLLNGAFLFAKLFLLRLVCQKKKRYRRRMIFKLGKRTTTWQAASFLRKHCGRPYNQ